MSPRRLESIHEHFCVLVNKLVNMIYWKAAHVRCAYRVLIGRNQLYYEIFSTDPSARHDGFWIVDENGYIVIEK